MSKMQTKTGGGRGGTALYIPVAALLVLFACILGISVFLRVSVVEVQGAGKYTPEEIISVAGITKGDNLLFLDTKSAEEQLRKELPYIETVILRRRMPNTVIIELKESTPAAFVYSVGAVWLIDAKCRTLEMAADGFDNLIRIDGITPVDPVPGMPLSLGDIPTTRLEVLAKVLTVMETEGVAGDVESLDIANIANISFHYLGRFTVVLGSVDQVDLKLERLVILAEQLDSGARGKINLSVPGNERLEPA